MTSRSFIKENFVLVVGLALPVLLMISFMIFATLPQRELADPPGYDLVFSTSDFNTGMSNLPVSVNFVVRDGKLKAQYVAYNPPGNYGNSWRKLYLYEAGTGKVRQLTFGYPADMDKIAGTREELVAATEDLTLDTTLAAPDGYQLSYEGYSRSGLFNDLFWGGGSSNEPRLRKGASSVRLAPDNSDTYFYYGDVQFIGWVKP
jgi:hypothetical protein